MNIYLFLAVGRVVLRLAEKSVRTDTRLGIKPTTETKRVAHPIVKALA
jgi:hypothetical protein